MLEEKLSKNSFASIHIGNNFNHIFDNHPDAIFILRSNGKLVNYNSALKALYGYSDSELAYGIQSYLTKDSQKLSKKFFRLALSGVAQHFYANVYHKKGKIIVVDVTLIPIIDHIGKVKAIHGIAKDITSFVQSMNELEKLKHSFDYAQETAKIGSWDYDLIEDEAYWSNQMYEIFGITDKQNFIPTFKHIREYIHPNDRERVEKAGKQAFDNRKNYSCEYRLIRPDGKLVHVFEHGDVILDENKLPIRYIGTTQDITKIKEIELTLRKNEQSYQNIYNHLEVGVWSFDLNHSEFIYFSPGVVKVIGYSASEIKTREEWFAIIHPDDLENFKKELLKLRNGESINHFYRIIHKNGETRWIQGQTMPVIDSNGELIKVDGIISNITEQKEYEAKIQHYTYHDFLTGLPNKRMLDEKIEKLIAANESFTIMWLEVERLRTFNETLGYGTVDRFIQQFSIRLTKLFGRLSLFARVNGDGFVLLLWGEHEKEHIIAQNINENLKEPFEVDDFVLYMTTTIGISKFPQNGKTREQIIAYALSSLNRVKGVRLNTFQLNPAIEATKRYRLERDLRKAIDYDELLLHFQPRVDSITGKIVSAEALIRWNHPIYGLISPGEFIPLAEENGLIHAIGDWVLKRVCRYIKCWEKANTAIVPISINISPQRLLKNDWIATVTSCLEETKVDPSLLEFEITESTLLKHQEEVKTAIDFIKRIGIRIALDDFGTGFSSLTYLTKYPIDTIKIDKSFISNISRSRTDEVIIKSVLFLAKGLQVTVVAEGVETKEQLEFLREQSSCEIQGFLFSKPIEDCLFQQLLKKGVLTF